MEQKRERHRRQWANDKNLKEMHIEILNLMMKESIQVVENMNSETKFSKAEVRLKLKDVQIQKLQEQLQIRDGVINEAKKLVDRSELPGTVLRDDRIMTIDQVMYDNAYLYEPISKNKAGINSGKESPRKHNYGEYGTKRAPAQNQNFAGQ